MNFQLLFPNKIIFQNGSSFQLGKIIKGNFDKPLIITGGNSIKRSGIYDKIIRSLVEEKIDYVEYSGIIGEPTPEIIDQVTENAKNKNIKSVIGIGGGSVIDTAKAVAALAVNKEGVENYLDGVGKNFKLKNNPLPFIAIPTTAGSGAEATKNAVVTSKVKKYKKSFRDDRLLAKIIIVDPQLTLSLPQRETAYSGMDAICQLIESFVSKKKNIYCLALSSYFIPKALESIIEAYNDSSNIQARTTMSASSLASGIALTNSGLGAVHGFAGGLGGMFNIPHGLICAVLLPGICEMNSKILPDAYRELARLINSDRSDNIDKMINLLYETNKKLNILDDFKDFSISKDKAIEIVERSQGPSMNGNPIDLTNDQLNDFIFKYL